MPVLFGKIYEKRHFIMKTYPLKLKLALFLTVILAITLCCLFVFLQTADLSEFKLDSDEGLIKTTIVVTSDREIKDYRADITKVFDDTYVLEYENESDANYAYNTLSKKSYVNDVYYDFFVSIDDVTEETEEDEAVISADGDNDYDYWGYEATGAYDYLDYVNSLDTQKTVVVAVMDTGINHTHELFEGRIISGGYDYIDNDGYPDDANGHGTHVAGIICQMTPDNVKILPLKVMDGDGRGTSTEIIKAFNKVATLKKSMNIVAVNLSLSSEVLNKNATYETYVNNLYANGVLSIAASGNDTYRADYAAPANSRRAITVGNIQQVNEKCFAYSSSNHGQYVDIAAPGTNIYSASHTDDVALVKKTGTSMAAPFVAGAVALLMCDPSNGIMDVEAILKNNAVDLGKSGTDEIYGSGMLNLTYAYANRTGFGVTFSDTAREHVGAFQVSLSCKYGENEFDIYYTTDKTTPSENNGVKYSSPITIKASCTLTAIAISKDGKHVSQLKSADYVVDGCDVAGAFITNGGTLTEYRGVLKDVVLPDSVTKIGDYAFADSQINSVTGEKVTTLGSYSFINSSVADVDFAKVKTIGKGCFIRCLNLENTDGIKTATTVGSSAFASSGLLTANLPKVKSLPSKAFWACESLTGVKLDALTQIKSKGAFTLTDVTGIVALSLTTLGEGVFDDKDEVCYLVVSSKLTTINANAVSKSFTLYSTQENDTAKNYAAGNSSVYFMEIKPEMTVLSKPAEEIRAAVGDVVKLSVDVSINSVGGSSITSLVKHVGKEWKYSSDGGKTFVAFTSDVLQVPTVKAGNVICVCTLTDLDGTKQMIETVVHVGMAEVSYSCSANGEVTPVYSGDGTVEEGKITAYCGESVGFNLNPAEGYRVKSVTVDGQRVETSDSFSLSNLDGNHEVYVEFYVADKYVVKVEETENGSVSVKNQKTEYSVGETVTVEVVADEGFGLKKLTVNGEETANTVFTVSGDMIIAAEFERIGYLITVVQVENGFISPESVRVAQGEDGTFTFVPDKYYHVAKIIVDGTELDGVSEYTFTNVSSAHTVTAVFERNTFTFTLGTVNNGTISLSADGTDVVLTDGKASLDCGVNLTIDFVADKHYHLVAFSVNGERRIYTFGESYVLYGADGDITLAAEFERNVFTLTLTEATSGSFSVYLNGAVQTEDVIVYFGGDNLEFRFVPDRYYGVSAYFVNGNRFEYYENTLVMSDAEGSFTFGVEFTHSTFVLTVLPTENGDVVVKANGADVEFDENGSAVLLSGAELVFEFIPEKYYRLVSAVVNGEEKECFDNKYGVSGTEENLTVSASFELIKLDLSVFGLENARVSITDENGESILLEDGSAVIDCGATIYFVVIPDEYFDFTGAVVNGKAVEVNADGSFVLTEVEQDIALTVLTERSTGTLTVGEFANGIVDVSSDVMYSGGQKSIGRGLTVTIKFYPVKDYRLESVTVNGESADIVNNELVFTFTEDVTVVPVFVNAIVEYDLTVSKGKCTLKTDSDKLIYGESVEFSVKTDFFHKADKVVVNGSEVEIKDGKFTVDSLDYGIEIEVFTVVNPVSIVIVVAAVAVLAVGAVITLTVLSKKRKQR